MAQECHWGKYPIADTPLGGDFQMILRMLLRGHLGRVNARTALLYLAFFQ